ncbi:AAEL010325-PA [Aedes aegypti]|uniref:AAEL010325-PA n=1 Tax=Aedes aegypti TaxID=7159 RepID=Q0IEJ9_AEDAE|nr:AAEL010325-PA [Aedes aegypti]
MVKLSILPFFAHIWRARRLPYWRMRCSFNLQILHIQCCRFAYEAQSLHTPTLLLNVVLVLVRILSAFLAGLISSCFKQRNQPTGWIVLHDYSSWIAELPSSYQHPNLGLHFGTPQLATAPLPRLKCPHRSILLLHVLRLYSASSPNTSSPH